ncbi:MAG: HAMP domain-containing histidine kinase [Bdellovibrionales bacterium]|nr:HAMP domain-containing histidine kinase [Bdellovibrionales bacterium]NQZ17912.1 HAMP domain-containing histidine kinase [Bdellovibrionales bacterium]
MLKKTTYSILRSPSLILLFAAVLVMAGFYIFQFESYHNQAIGDVNLQIDNKNRFLSKAIFDNNDKEPFKTLLDSLQVTLLSSYVVEKATGEVFVQSGAEKMCQKPILKRLINDGGVFVGNVRYCISDTKLAANIFSSLPTLIFIIVILFFAIITPLFASNKHLGIMLEAAENPNESVRDFYLRVKRLPSSTKEVLLRIHQKNKDALEASKLQMQLENENLHSELIKQAAHDMRGAAQSLLQNKKLKGHLTIDDAEKTVHRILSICDQIREKATTGVYTLNKFENTNVLETIEQKVAESSILSPEINFEVDCSIDSNIIAPKDDFYRVFSNLIDNSCDALKDVKKGRIKIVVFTRQSKVLLSVEDNGLGIPKNIQSLVFNQNFSSGKENGTGIGLYYVHKKMIQWGGKVEFETSDKGTKFTLILNRAEVKEDKYESNV